MKKLFTFLFIICLSGNLFAQWYKFNGGENVPFNEIVLAGDKMFAKNSYTIFYSDNKGASWNFLLATSPYFYSSMRIKDTTIYILAHQGIAYRMYYSSINNFDWNYYDCNGFGGSGIDNFVIKDEMFFGGGNFQGLVFRSDDYGRNWTSVSNGLIIGFTSFCNDGNAIELFTDGINLYGATFCYGIYYSTNDGQSWSPLNNGIPLNTKNRVWSLAKKNNLFYAVTDKGTFVSYNNGQLWQLNNSLPTHGYRVAIVNDDILLISRNNGIFFSGDNGTTWCDFPENLYFNTLSTGRVISDGTDFFFPESHNGVTKFKVADSTFSLKSYGLTKNNALNMYIDSSTFLASTLGGGLYYSNNFANSWNINENSMLGIIVNSIIKKDSILVASTNYGVYYSYDNGINWSTTNFSLNTYNIKSILLKDSVLFAGTECGVFMKADSDTLWHSNNSGLVDSTINRLYIYNDTLFACTNKGVSFFDNNYFKWNNYFSQLSSYNIYTFVKTDNIITVGSDELIFISYDNGNNWCTYNFSVGEKINDIISIDTNVFAASTTGVYVFWNSQQIWFNLLSENNVNKLVTLGDSILYALTQNGIFGTYVSQSFILNTEEINAIKNISIYPNPFSTYLKIDFKKHTEENFYIKIFDLKGVELYSHKFNNVTSNIIIKDFDIKQKGIYLIQILSESINHSWLFYKE